MSLADNVNRKGYLSVGDGHSIYWEDWGNSKANPVFHLHGGPGAQFHDGHKALYNPNKHHVIFHDQRGSGRSKPFASTVHNTTQDMISDIEKLRVHLGLGTIYLAGGSWGSTLSLLYAINYPKNTRALLVWSIYLARQAENDYVNEGRPQTNFPVEWERFISLVPEKHRKNGTAIMQYYSTIMRGKDLKLAKKFAYEWSLWESTLMSIEYDPISLAEETKADRSSLSMALLETHYFLNHCFVRENFILDNLSKIKHLSCSIIQGRFDFLTPPQTAFELARAWGSKSSLTWVNSGHIRSDPEMFNAIKKTASKLFK